MKSATLFFLVQSLSALELSHYFNEILPCRGSTPADKYWTYCRFNVTHSSVWVTNQLGVPSWWLPAMGHARDKGCLPCQWKKRSVTRRGLAETCSIASCHRPGQSWLMSTLMVIWAKQNLIWPSNGNLLLATEIDIYSQLSLCSDQMLNNTAFVWNKYNKYQNTTGPSSVPGFRSVLDHFAV